MENPPSPSQEPNAKKLKMSTTTSDDENCEAAAATDGSRTQKKPRYKRRKIAIFFAYCGVGYQGMQKNPGAKTIEGDLEEALYLSGAVPEQDRGYHKRYDWARSARTDKGVSAVGQVVSGRFYVDPPGLVDRLTSNLPSQIRIFGYKRVTGSFNAKKFCDRRRYVYLFPVFALDPASHPDRESVLASMGSDTELVKCLECSERGRKVVGIMGKRFFESTVMESNSVLAESNDAIASTENENNNALNADSTRFELITESNCVLPGSGIVSNVGTALADSEFEQRTATSLENKNNNDLNADSINKSEEMADQNENKIKGREPGIEELGSESGLDKCGNGEVMKPLKEKESSFYYGEEEKERFNRILKNYEGTHNFHNFTTRTKAEDPSARRFIVSFDAQTIINVEGIDFVKCEVVGQSFMLHQIRKMIGLAVAVMRNCAPESLIERALLQDVRINIPTAPEVGLYLDECFFTSYNQKWKDSHEELSMKAYAEEAEDFKMKHIYSHIASTEHKEGTVALWLHSLNHRNYPDLRVDDCEATDDLNSTKIVDMGEGE